MRATMWATICRITFVVMLIGMGIYFFAPQDHLLQTIASIAILILIIVALTGAGMGFAMAAGELKLRCPECDENAHVVGGHKKSLFLDCPKCGGIEFAIGGFRNRWTVLGEPEDSEFDS